MTALTAYVNYNGNDSTAILNDPTRPFKTIPGVLNAVGTPSTPGTLTIITNTSSYPPGGISPGFQPVITLSLPLSQNNITFLQSPQQVPQPLQPNQPFPFPQPFQPNQPFLQVNGQAVPIIMADDGHEHKSALKAKLLRKGVALNENDKFLLCDTSTHPFELELPNKGKDFYILKFTPNSVNSITIKCKNKVYKILEPAVIITNSHRTKNTMQVLVDKYVLIKYSARKAQSSATRNKKWSIKIKGQPLDNLCQVKYNRI